MNPLLDNQRDAGCCSDADQYEEHLHGRLFGVCLLQQFRKYCKDIKRQQFSFREFNSIHGGKLCV